MFGTYEFNALSFIYNYLEHVLAQLVGMQWNHAEVMMGWIAARDFENTTSLSELLNLALQQIADSRRWTNFYIKDTGKIQFSYILPGQLQQRTAYFNRVIVGPEDNSVEIELLFDFLPFGNVVNTVCKSGKVTKSDCDLVYNEYLQTLEDYFENDSPTMANIYLI